MCTQLSYHFHASSKVMFSNNRVFLGGAGAALFACNSFITFHGNLIVIFSNNSQAKYGVAAYAWNSNIFINGSSKVHSFTTRLHGMEVQFMLHPLTSHSMTVHL